MSKHHAAAHSASLYTTRQHTSLPAATDDNAHMLPGCEQLGVGLMRQELTDQGFRGFGVKCMRFMSAQVSGSLSGQFQSLQS